MVPERKDIEPDDSTRNDRRGDPEEFNPGPKEPPSEADDSNEPIEEPGDDDPMTDPDEETRKQERIDEGPDGVR